MLLPPEVPVGLWPSLFAVQGAGAKTARHTPQKLRSGNNVNLAKRILLETAGCDIYWLEEPFHEDEASVQPSQGVES